MKIRAAREVKSSSGNVEDCSLVSVCGWRLEGYGFLWSVRVNTLHFTVVTGKSGLQISSGQ